MKKLDNISKDRFQALVMKAVDGDLSESEKSTFETLIAQNPIYKKEWEEFKKLKEVTDKVQLYEPTQEEWDMYWNNVYNRLERGLAWLLLSFGTLLILGFATYKFIEEFYLSPNIPLIITIGITAVFSGLFALTLSIIREKLHIRKTDPYKEVQR